VGLIRRDERVPRTLTPRNLVPKDLVARLRSAGLLAAFEDAGVPSGVPGGPFEGPAPHELLGCVLVLEHYADRLADPGVDPMEVCAYVLGYSLDWLVDDADAIEADLADALDLHAHEVWVAQSYVPEYEPDELWDIPIAHRNSTRSVAETGLYGDRDFEGSTPFVYVPTGHHWAAIEHLRGAFERARAGGAT
jgi:hypothetical protein